MYMGTKTATDCTADTRVKTVMMIEKIPCMTEWNRGYYVVVLRRKIVQLIQCGSRCSSRMAKVLMVKNAIDREESATL